MRDIRALVADLEGARSILVDAFEEAAGADHHVSAGDLSELLGALARVDRTAQAGLLAATAQLARREDVPDAEDCQQVVEKVHALGFVEELASTTLAMTLGISTRSAGSRVSRAARLAVRLPRVLRAVAAGLIETAQAERVLREVEEIDSLEHCLAVDDFVADRLGRCDITRLGQLARYAVGRICPEALRTRAVVNEADRFVAVCPGPVGMAEIYATVPAAKAAALWEATCELAQDYIGEDPSLTTDQARADAFIDLALANVTVTARVDLGLPVVASGSSVLGDATPRGGAAQPPAEPRLEAVPGGTLEDCADWDERRDVDSDPWYDRAAADPVAAQTAPSEQTAIGPVHLSGVYLPKVGYVPSDVVAGLVSDVGVQIGLALLDARTGVLLGSTRCAYRPTAEMRHFVEIRDRRCRMFGCELTAQHWDLDHAVPHPRGATSPANLAGLCRRHHRAKQRRRWQYHLRPDGVAVWQSPHGITRFTYPQDVLPPRAAPLPPTRIEPPPPRRTPSANTPADTAVTEDRYAGPPPF